MSNVAPMDPRECSPTVTAGYPPGARVARLFGDGCWYDGTVLEAPWPLGHRWGHWRRVRFDGGETHDVDTDAWPACFRALHEGTTAARAARLEALGFVSEVSTGRGPDEAAWEAQLAQLAAYKRGHGDCNVPQCWADDPRLGNWVTNQRKRKKLLDRGEQGATDRGFRGLT